MNLRMLLSLTLVLAMATGATMVQAAPLNPEGYLFFTSGPDGQFTTIPAMFKGSQEIAQAFAEATGLNLEKDLKRFGAVFLPGFNPVISVEGKFDPARLIAELKKEKPELKVTVKDGIHLMSHNKFVISFAADSIIGALEGDFDLADSAIRKDLQSQLAGFGKTDRFILYLAPAKPMLEQFVGSLEANPQIPPPVLGMVKELKTLTLRISGNELVMDAGLSAAGKGEEVKAMLDGLLSMGKMALEAEEEQVRERMKSAKSAFRLLLDDEIHGKMAGIDLAKDLLGRVKHSAKGSVFSLSVRLPDSFQNPQSLMAVVGVVGVAAAIAIPAFVKQRDMAMDSVSEPVMVTDEDSGTDPVVDEDSEAGTPVDEGDFVDDDQNTDDGDDSAYDDDGGAEEKPAGGGGWN